MNPVDVMGGLARGLTSQYTIKRELGRGAMGTVYLAWDVKHARMVAVKVINPELSAAIGRARFLREINIAATFNHPHILPLHDSDETDGSLYYVMPYVDGESLRDLLARGKMTDFKNTELVATKNNATSSTMSMRNAIPIRRPQRGLAPTALSIV